MQIRRWLYVCMVMLESMLRYCTVILYIEYVHIWLPILLFNHGTTKLSQNHESVLLHTPPNALIHMVGWSHISPGRTRLAYPPSPNALATSTPYLTGFTYFVQGCRYEKVGSCVSQEDIMGLYDRSTNIASRRDDGLWSRCCGILLS